MNATRTEIADAFRAARSQVESGSHDFICNALNEGTEAGRAALRIIHERMGYVERGPSGYSYSEGPFTLQAWLRLHGHHTTREDIPADVMRAYRLRWLDALIEEFSK